MIIKIQLIKIILIVALLCVTITLVKTQGDLKDYQKGFWLKGTYMAEGNTQIENEYLVFMGKNEGNDIYYYKQNSKVQKGKYLETEHPNLYQIASNIKGITGSTILIDKEGLYLVNNGSLIYFSKIADIPSFINVDSSIIN